MKESHQKRVGILALLALMMALGSGAYLWIERGSPEETHVHEQSGGIYGCSMHPEVVQDHPGSCPICGMDLALMESMEGDTEEDRVAGRATVRISDDSQRQVGIKTTEVQKKSLEMIVRAYGRVVYDPELYNAQQDFLSARLAVRQSGLGVGSATLEAAKVRLRLLGMALAQIRDLASRGRVDERLLHGTRGGKALVYAQIYESDIALVHAGQEARAWAPAYPGKVFTGRVISLDPVLDPETRSLRAHLEVKDPQRRLKPGMSLNVRVQNSLGETLTIPETAVLRTGERNLVFVDKGQGRFQPREIQTGHQSGGWVQVLSGLSQGERVVHDGTFLLDSESQLRASTGSAFYSRHD